MNSRRFRSRAATRRNKWQDDFIAALQEHGTVLHAAKVAGVSRFTVYNERKKDPAFAEKWDDALEHFIETLEIEAHRRALKGSDLLLIFLLKAHRPEVYRENLSVNVNYGHQFRLLVEKYKITPEEIRNDPVLSIAASRWNLLEAGGGQAGGPGETTSKK